jgi:hypothetical protein
MQYASAGPTAQSVSPQPLPPKKASRVPYGIITIVLIVVILAAGLAYFLLGDSTSETKGELEIKDVYHEPLEPDTDDIVYYYIEIFNSTSSHHIVYKEEVYNGSRHISSGSGDLARGSSSKTLYSHSTFMTDYGYETGYEVQFWVEIYDENWDPESNQIPVLTSEVDSFIIS